MLQEPYRWLEFRRYPAGEGFAAFGQEGWSGVGLTAGPENASYDFPCRFPLNP